MSPCWLCISALINLSQSTAAAAVAKNKLVLFFVAFVAAASASLLISLLLLLLLATAFFFFWGFSLSINDPRGGKITTTTIGLLGRLQCVWCRHTERIIRIIWRLQHETTSSLPVPHTLH